MPAAAVGSSLGGEQAPSVEEGVINRVKVTLQIVSEDPGGS